MRNPDRTLSFLQTVAEIEGEVWNHATQCRYQSLLIKNRFYTPSAENLPGELYALIQDYTHEMTYEEAAEIFARKQYVDAPMRGRTSFDPLEKLGLVELVRRDNGTETVAITDFGQMFLDGRIDLGEMVFTSLLKTQFPYPLSNGFRDYNIKPFIGTLRLIRRVNELCVSAGFPAHGISREEFGIFMLSLKNYQKIDATAERLLAFRQCKKDCNNDNERAAFVSTFIADYLSNFQNAEKNIKEYSDNIIRYLRLTKYIYIRGGGYYIDLEPRRMIEINSILEADSGAAMQFESSAAYTRYISDYHAYTLPFETVTALADITRRIVDENNALAANLGEAIRTVEIPNTVTELRRIIAELRERRTELQNLQIRREYQETQRIDEAITALSNTLNRNIRGANRPPIELEKWTNIALNILNDARLIKANAPLGDDNEPTFTAPANVPDIECYYDGFGVICEVTMRTGRDQWYYEGQPVLRHLRAFEQVNNAHENYCLFIAPRIHADTINTFWMAVRYEYEGQCQKIVPITITGLINILRAVRDVKSTRKSFQKEDIRRLYNNCIDISNLSDSTRWQEHIGNVIALWAAAL